MPSLEEIPNDTFFVMRPPVGGGAYCGDGSPYHFLVRKGTTNVNKVIVDFIGGGACWNERCVNDNAAVQGLSSTSFVMQSAALLHGLTTSQASEIVNSMNLQVIGVSSEVQVADTATWTYIAVLYCTQDVHVGACTTTYQLPDGSANRTVHHNGAANARAVMNWVYDNFPKPEVLAFMGCSAGASLAPVIEVMHAKSRYGADTTIVALGDSASNLLTDKFVMDGLPRWGPHAVFDEIPGFFLEGMPSNLHGDLTSTAFSAVFSLYPDVQFGYFTRTDDQIQAYFANEMGGLIPSELDLDARREFWNLHNLAMLEGLQAANPNFRTFVAAGNDHCTATFDHALQEPGFLAWLEDLLSGGAPPAVACSSCTLADVPGCDGVNGSGRIDDRCGVCGGSGTSCAARSVTAARLSCAVDASEGDPAESAELPASRSPGGARSASWVCAGAVVCGWQIVRSLRFAQ